MTDLSDVHALQSVAERLARIANDCFDLKAVERLRNLVDELQAGQGLRYTSQNKIGGELDAGKL